MAETARAMISRVLGSSRDVEPGRLGMHERLQAGPDDLELDGVGGEGAPDRRHEVDILGLLDIGKDRGDGACGFVLFERAEPSRCVLQAWPAAFWLSGSAAEAADDCERQEACSRALDALSFAADRFQL